MKLLLTLALKSDKVKAIKATQWGGPAKPSRSLLSQRTIFIK